MRDPSAAKAKAKESAEPRFEVLPREKFETDEKVAVEATAGLRSAAGSWPLLKLPELQELAHPVLLPQSRRSIGRIAIVALPHRSLDHLGSVFAVSDSATHARRTMHTYA